MVACGDYGDMIIVQDRVGVPGSPWWCEAVHDFVDELGLDSGEVVELSITFRNYCFWRTGTRYLAR